MPKPTVDDKILFYHSNILCVGVWIEVQEGDIKRPLIQCLNKKERINPEFVKNIEIIGKHTRDDAKVIPIAIWDNLTANIRDSEIVSDQHLKEWLNDMPGIAYTEIIENAGIYLHLIEQPKLIERKLGCLQLYGKDGNKMEWSLVEKLYKGFWIQSQDGDDIRINEAGFGNALSCLIHTFLSAEDR